MTDSNQYRLTEFSHGAGCGCKISPAVLDTILQTSPTQAHFPNLLIGNQDRDDAAVMDLGDGSAIISTTDFFMPIVDDPFDFGRIAAVNAISDIYAMGGTPLMAIAILGWPVNTLPAEVAGKVIEGGRDACSEAGIPLAGGHSIDSPEPIFGLAVTGRVPITGLKANGGARPGDLLFLTKPLGVGMLTTAQKHKKLLSQHSTLARDSMVRLNTAGSHFSSLPYVHAMTDVTGFGLAGHLREMCAASGTRAHIRFADLPLIDPDALTHYFQQGCIPGGSTRNWDSYGQFVRVPEGFPRTLVCDPQTSGGLLVSVHPDFVNDFLREALTAGLSPLTPIGHLEPYATGHLVTIDIAS
jgi:selenide,water dikinase